jgi:hypothetical protein
MGGDKTKKTDEQTRCLSVCHYHCFPVLSSLAVSPLWRNGAKAGGRLFFTGSGSPLSSQQELAAGPW